MTRNAARVLVLAIGAVYAWQYRFFINPDGVAYLDLADRIRAHGWTLAVNAHWSPLLPWVLRFLNAGARYESTAAHGVAFLMFCAAFASFDYLLRELRRNDAAWIAIAYALFLWACNFAEETGPALLTPDLLVAAELFLASALLVRIARGGAGWGTYAALGASLGVSYLSKAPMFPLGICILIVAAILGGRRVVLSAALLLAIGSLYFVPLSRKLGRLSIGDSGRHNYIWRVASAGQPVHPRQLLFADPRIDGFGEARDGGTYAVHDDPGYWAEGLRPRFEVRAQLAALWSGAKVYAGVLRSPLHLALLVLLLTAIDGLAPLRWRWYLLIPAAAALAMFAAVLVEVRYVSAAIAVLWLAMLVDVRLRPRVVAGVLIAVLVAALGAPENRSELVAVVQGAPPEDFQLAQFLAQSGVKPGDRVAFAGPGFMCYWARLAKVHLVAEAEEADELWNADDEARRAAEAALWRYGVRAFVATDAPEDAGPCWRRVGGTSYSVCLGVQ